MGRKVERSWQRNYSMMKEYLGHNDDVVFREFQVGRKHAVLVYMSGLVDKAILAQSVMTPLLKHKGPITEEDIINTVSVPGVQTTHDLQTAVQKIAQQSVLFVDGLTVAFLMDVSAMEQRSVDEPDSETVIREGLIRDSSKT